MLKAGSTLAIVKSGITKIVTSSSVTGAASGIVINVFIVTVAISILSIASLSTASASVYPAGFSVPSSDEPYTDTHYTDTHYTDTHYTDTHYTDAHYTDAHYTDADHKDAPYTDTPSSSGVSFSPSAFSSAGTSPSEDSSAFSPGSGEYDTSPAASSADGPSTGEAERSHEKLKIESAPVNSAKIKSEPGGSLWIELENSLPDVNAAGAADQAAEILESLTLAALSLASAVSGALGSSAGGQSPRQTIGDLGSAGGYPLMSYYTVLTGAAALALTVCLVRSPFFRGENWSSCRTEAEFDERCIKPLLKSWGFVYNYQKPCEIRSGSEVYRGRIDFFVYDDDRPLTLFEDKLSIDSAGELEDACDQARSYALQFRLNNYVIASKQGLRLYRFEVSGDTLIRKVSPRRLNWWTKRSLKKSILRLRGHARTQSKANEDVNEEDT